MNIYWTPEEPSELMDKSQLEVASLRKDFLDQRGGFANMAVKDDVGLSFADTDPMSSDSELGDILTQDP